MQVVLQHTEYAWQILHTNPSALVNRVQFTFPIIIIIIIFMESMKKVFLKQLIILAD